MPNLRQINLDNGKTADRPGLVREILRAHGDLRAVPEEPKDIGLLSEFLEQRKPALAFLRFDHVLHRPYQVDFFANLRFHGLSTLTKGQARRPVLQLLMRLVGVAASE